MAQGGAALSLFLALPTFRPRMAPGWLGWPWEPWSCQYLWPPHRGCQTDHPHPAGQETTLPSLRVAVEREKKEDRLQLAWETGLLVPISPPRTPACPSLPSRLVHRGLGSARKVRQLFRDWERGEVRSPSLARVQPL